MFFRKPETGKSNNPESYLCLPFPSNDHIPHNNGNDERKYEGVKIYGSIYDTLAGLEWYCHAV
jgi:hypothetical protein